MKITKKIKIINILNIIKILVTVVASFLIPKFLSLDGYSNYKIFTFYLNFLVLFAFGTKQSLIINLDTKKGNTEFFKIFYISILVSVLSTIILLVFNVFLGNKEIYLWVILMTPFINSFGLVNFYLKSHKKLISSAIVELITPLVTFLSIIFLIIINISSFIPLIAVYFITYLLITLFIMKKFIIKKHLDFKNDFKVFLKHAKFGFPLEISYFVGFLAFGLDRIFIERFYLTDNYSYYTFAYTLLNIFLNLLRSGSAIIIPYFKDLKEEKLKIIYKFITKFIDTAFYFFAIFLPLIPIFINVILSKYQESSNIIILLYIVTFSQIHYMLKYRQFFFILKKGKDNLALNCLLLLMAFLSNLLVLYLKLPYIYFCYSSIFSFLLWNIIMEIYYNKLIKTMNLKYIFLNLFISAIIILYINEFINIIIYLLITFSFFIFSAIYLRSDFQKIKKEIIIFDSQ